MDRNTSSICQSGDKLVYTHSIGGTLPNKPFHCISFIVLFFSLRLQHIINLAASARIMLWVWTRRRQTHARCWRKLRRSSTSVWAEHDGVTLQQRGSKAHDTRAEIDGRQTGLLIFTYLLFFAVFLRKAVAFWHEISHNYRWASCYPVTVPTWSIFLAQFFASKHVNAMISHKTYIYIYKYISLCQWW